ncbi:MAG: hypothetical protein LBH40_00760 [Alphaproteobacteria bacterium]|jgi:hypothetical protein|nr:hypothetical protein [Alphaproteobacteria bacterium]
MLDILNYDEVNNKYIMTPNYNENKYLLQTSSNNRYFYGLHENYINLKQEIKTMIKNQSTLLNFNLFLLDTLLVHGFRHESLFVSPKIDERGFIQIYIKFNNKDFTGA